MREHSEHHRELREVVAAIASDRYAPQAAGWDENRTPFPHDERRYLGSLGFLGMALPEKYGGGGAPLLDALVVIEELAKHCRPAAFQVFEANTGPARVVSLMGTDEQRERFLPSIAAGDQTMAVAISEPDAGRDRHDHQGQAVQWQLHTERRQALDLQRRRGRRIPGLHPAQ